MFKQRRSAERQFALFLLGVILLVPPVLAVFNRPVRAFGIPSLYLYIFLVWLGLILVTLAITRRMRLDEQAAANAPVLSDDHMLTSSTDMMSDA